MATGIQDFYRGDTKKYKILVKNKTTNVPISVDGGVLTVTFKKKKDLPDSDASLQVITNCVEANPAEPTGEVRVLLTSEDTDLDTGLYYYDFQFVSSDGEVTTILTGTLKILQDITIGTDGS